MIGAAARGDQHSRRDGLGAPERG